jgi:hypothetical protein
MHVRLTNRIEDVTAIFVDASGVVWPTGCVSAAARCLIETTSTIMPERRRVRRKISRPLQTRVIRGPTT